MTSCPQCGEPGRKVGKITVEAHTLEAHRPSPNDSDDWRFCRSSSCAVGYFVAGSEPILLDQMGTVPFPKSDAPERLVCFCFEHTVAAVAQDARSGPESTIKATITEGTTAASAWPKVASVSSALTKLKGSDEGLDVDITELTYARDRAQQVDNAKDAQDVLPNAKTALQRVIGATADLSRLATARTTSLEKPSELLGLH